MKAVVIHAASINHVDLWIRKGLPGLRFPFPLIPGGDDDGIVMAVGEQVSGPDPGTRVVINPGISCGRCEFCAAGHWIDDGKSSRFPRGDAFHV